MLTSARALFWGLTSLFCVLGAAAQRSVPLELAAQPLEHLAKFGTATAISGDTLVVSAVLQDNGAIVNAGAATIYRWGASGWTPEATIHADDGASADLFGYSVAIFGNLVAVGAPGVDIDGRESQGAVYIFSRSGATWTQVAKLTADDGAVSDWLGRSVAIFGNVVVSGAPRATVGGLLERGAAYVFASTDGVWSQRQKFTDEQGAEYAGFGMSVSIYDYVIAVGAPFDTVGGNVEQGSASFFVRTNPVPQWTLGSRVTNSIGSAGDQFGKSVAASGTVVFVGSPRYLSTDVGAVTWFQRSGTSWIEQSTVSVIQGTNNWMGETLAYDAGTLVVGSPGRTVDGVSSAGTVQTFKFNGSWTFGPRFELPAPGPQDGLGMAVAISGDTIVVGAPGHDLIGVTDAGTAWVLSRVGSTWINRDAAIVADDGASNDLFGSAVDISANTAVIGASQDDGTFANQGSVYVKIRSSFGSGWNQVQKLVATDPAVNDYFGNAVSIDGGTLIVGAPLDDIGINTDQGSAYVYTWNGSAFVFQQKLTASDGAGDDYFGWSVCVRGNTAMIGALRDDQSVSLTNTGSLYIFTRSGSVWTQAQKIVPGDLESGDQFGAAVAIDGAYAIVGSPNANPGSLNNRGAVYAYVLSGSTWSFQQKLTASGGLMQDNFGKLVGLSGFRAIIGSPGRDVGPNADQGAAYAFTRSGSVWSQTEMLTASDGAAGDLFGEKVAVSGRVAAVSAIFDDVGPASDRGSAYLFTTQTDRWLQATKILVPNTNAGAFTGVSLALQSDTMLIGASSDDVGANGAQGSVYSTDVPADDFAVASNQTLGANVFPTLAAALATAAPGHQFAVSEAAFRTVDPIEVLDPDVAILSSASLRTPLGTTVRFDDGLASTGSYSFIQGNHIGLFGPIVIGQGDHVILSPGSRAVFGAGPALTVPEEARLDIDFTGPIHTFRPVSVVSSGRIEFSGAVFAAEPVTMAGGTSLEGGGTFNNFSEFTSVDSYLQVGLFWNRNSVLFGGLVSVWGNYYNELGAVTSLFCGTLNIGGELSSGGALRFESLPEPCFEPPVLSVAGDIALFETSELSLPADGAVVETDGSFINMITSNSRFDLSRGQLWMGGGPTTFSSRYLEVASTDIGPSSAGLNRNLPGHFPIGTLKCDPLGNENIELLDSFDNDGDGMDGPPEALYVDTLHLGFGANLFTYNLKIYYRTLINDGWVDHPSNLIPYCVSDVDGVPGTDLGDFFLFLNCFDVSDPCADIDGSPGVDLGDFFAFLNGFDAGC